MEKKSISGHRRYTHHRYRYVRFLLGVKPCHHDDAETYCDVARADMLIRGDSVECELDCLGWWTPWLTPDIQIMTCSFPQETDNSETPKKQ